MTHVPFVDGQVVTAAQLNVLGGAWQTYTPVWNATVTSPSIGNGNLSGRWKTVGDNLVIAQVLMNTGSTTTLGSGQYVFGLPVTASAQQTLFIPCGWAVYAKSGTGTTSGVAYINAGSPTQVFIANAAAVGNTWGPTGPVPSTGWSTSPACSCYVHVVYEPA